MAEYGPWEHAVREVAALDCCNKRVFPKGKRPHCGQTEHPCHVCSARRIVEHLKCGEHCGDENHNKSGCVPCELHGFCHLCEVEKKDAEIERLRKANEALCGEIGDTVRAGLLDGTWLSVAELVADLEKKNEVLQAALNATTIRRDGRAYLRTKNDIAMDIGSRRREKLVLDAIQGDGNGE